ncbi:MAG: hypothetical protein V5A62_09905 [Haloarculaceae archaeon]
MSPGAGVDGAGEDPAGVSRLRKLLDALAYALVLSLAVFLAATAVSFALGGGWGGVKYLLFVLGFLAFGLGAFILRPTPPWRDEPLVQRSGETPFERFVRRLLGDYALAPDQQLPAAARVFVAGVVLLAVSFVMETVFGVVI